MSLTLVTGSTGFLGSRIVRRLVDDGVPVFATSRSRHSQFACSDYRSVDLLDFDKTLSLMPNVRRVIHAAGLAHCFKHKLGDSVDFEANNAIAAENVARAAAASGVGQLVLVSSVAVYGVGGAGPRDETAPCHPRGPYAESKLEGEVRVMQVARDTGLNLTVLRLATLYGEGDRGNVARLMQAIDRGRFVWVGPGDNLKSLVHVDDAAWACVLAAQGNGDGDPIQVFNVCAAPSTMRQVVNGLAQALGHRLPRTQIPAGAVKLALGAVAASLGPWSGRALTWQGTLDKWLADDAYCGERFQRKFGFQPQVELFLGLQRQVAAYRGELGEPILRKVA